MFGGGNLFSTQQKLCKIHVSKDSVIELSHKKNDFFTASWDWRAAISITAVYNQLIFHT